jgi:hypothetical protein
VENQAVMLPYLQENMLRPVTTNASQFTGSTKVGY